MQDNLFLSQLLTRIVIGLVDSAAFNGHYSKNPFNFRLHGLSFLSLFLEGKQIPAKPLTPDFPNRMYVRSFFNLFTGTGTVNKDVGDYIEYRDFPDGYALFAFDLSPSLLDGNQVELVKSGSLILELKFNAPLPEPVHVIAYAELDSCWKWIAVVRFSLTLHHERRTTYAAPPQRPVCQTYVSGCVSQRQTSFTGEHTVPVCLRHQYR